MLSAAEVGARACFPKLETVNWQGALTPVSKHANAAKSDRVTELISDSASLYITHPGTSDSH